MQPSEKTTVHQVQAEILLALAKSSKTNFAALNTEGLPSDWFSFHMRQVVKYGWVEKNDGQYSLTNIGKKVVIQLNANTKQFEPAQRVSVLLVIRNAEKFVVQQRVIEPFKGFWEFPTKKIGYGQSPSDVVSDVLEHELGLKAKNSFIGVVHKVETGGEGVFDDKYYFVYECESAEGTMNADFFGGTNHWLSEKELKEKELSHFDMEATLSLLKKNKIGFEEIQGEAVGY